MAKPKSKGDTFGTFLRTIQEIENHEDAARQNTNPTPQSAQPAPGSLERSRKVLLYLAEHDGPQPVTDLLPVSGLTFSDFYSAITTLREVGLIAMSGDPGHEHAELTTAGKYVALME